MELEQLTKQDIHDVMELSDAVSSNDGPKELTGAELNSEEFKEWFAASDRLAVRIDDLSDHAKAELVALAWLGRGDSGDDFDVLLSHAKSTINSGTSRYLAGKPLRQYLQDGARKLGISI